MILVSTFNEPNWEMSNKVWWQFDQVGIDPCRLEPERHLPANWSADLAKKNLPGMAIRTKPKLCAAVLKIAQMHDNRIIIGQYDGMLRLREVT